MAFPPCIRAAAAAVFEKEKTGIYRITLTAASVYFESEGINELDSSRDDEQSSLKRNRTKIY